MNRHLIITLFYLISFAVNLVRIAVLFVIDTIYTEHVRKTDPKVYALWVGSGLAKERRK